ncbi:MAG TPA: HAD family phosphatase [Pontiella sp.]|nr:HAD family phosphatase [Pontiella sp.]
MNLWDYEAFILDLDGTLIDSGKYHARAFADAVLEHSGYELTPAEHYEFFGSHSTWFSRTLNERYGLDLDPEKVLESKRMRMEEIYVVELFAGAHEFLVYWQGRRPMALATNSPRHFVEPALEKADIKDYFDVIVTADDVAHRKPDPEMIEITLQKLCTDPLRTLVFEDQIIGVEAARRAGARVVAVDNGQPVRFPVDVPVHTWAELLSFSERP